MKLSSPAFKPNESIPQIYTCQGKDINPPLEIADVPPRAQSLVLILDDHDVPENLRKDRLWVHWVVYDIPPTTTYIDEGHEAPGTLGVNTGGKNGYMGPCPPDKEHRYHFTLYALDQLLALAEGATKAEIIEKMKGHILAESQLMGRYELS